MTMMMTTAVIVCLFHRFKPTDIIQRFVVASVHRLSIVSALREHDDIREDPKGV